MLNFLNNLVFTLAFPWPIIFVFVLVFLICLVAFISGGLTFSGACFACLFGVCVLFNTRFEGFALFCLFYVSCALVSRLSGKQKHERRSWVQVAANGTMAVLGSFIYTYTGSLSGLVIFASSVAEAASDTWAGDIGRLSKIPPVSITTFKQVDKGISGGVTILGFIGGFAGSLLIAFSFGLLFSQPLKYVIIVLASGFSGCVLDSVLGSSIQALYYDSSRGIYTEDPSFTHVKGLKIVDNNMVNFMSNVFSSVLALGMMRILA